MRTETTQSKAANKSMESFTPRFARCKTTVMLNVNMALENGAHPAGSIGSHDRLF